MWIVRTSLKIFAVSETKKNFRLSDPGSFIRRADEVDYAERHEYDHHKNWNKNYRVWKYIFHNQISWYNQADWFGFSSIQMTGYKNLGRFQDMDLRLVHTEIFTVNISRLYQLKTHLLQHEHIRNMFTLKESSCWVYVEFNMNFDLIRNDRVLEPPEHNSLS